MAKHYRRKSRKEIIRDRLILASLVLLISVCTAAFFKTRCCAVQDNAADGSAVSADITAMQDSISADVAAFKAAAALSSDLAAAALSADVPEKKEQEQEQKKTEAVSSKDVKVSSDDKKQQPAAALPPDVSADAEAVCSEPEDFAAEDVSVSAAEDPPAPPQAASVPARASMTRNEMIFFAFIPCLL